MINKTVKHCPGCGVRLTIDRIIQDPEIEILGMSVDHDKPHYNFYYFNHMAAGCGSTFVLHVECFRVLVDEPVPKTVQLGASACANHCLTLADDNECDLDCHWAPFRRLLGQMVKAKQGFIAKLPAKERDLEEPPRQFRTA